MQKIAIVCSYYSSVGGISSYIKELERQYKTEGKKIIIITPDIKNTTKNKRKISKQRRIYQSTEVLRLLTRINATVIQCHGPWYLQLGCVIYKGLHIFNKKKIYITVVKHSDKEHNRNPLKKFLFQELDNSCDLIAFSSNYLKNKYITNGNYKYRLPIKIATPGPPKICNPSEKVTLVKTYTKSKTPILTYLGLFEYPGKVKGLLLLIDVISNIKETYPNILLLIGGKGSKEYEVREKIKSLELEDHAVVLPFITNPYDLLNVTDLHCHITFQDSFGQVILEALSANKKVVASAVGEIPSMGVNGVTTTKNTIKEISEKIVDELAGNNPIESIPYTDKYSWETTSQNLLPIIIND